MHKWKSHQLESNFWKLLSVWARVLQNKPIDMAKLSYSW